MSDPKHRHAHADTHHRVQISLAQRIWAPAKTMEGFLSRTPPTSVSNEMAGLVQSPVKDLRTSHVNRTSRSAMSEAISSSRMSYLRSPDQASTRPDSDMELSLEMTAKVGSKLGREDPLCCRC